MSLPKTMQSAKTGSKSDITKNFIALLRAIKLHNMQCGSILRDVLPRPVLLSTHCRGGSLVTIAIIFNKFFLVNFDARIQLIFMLLYFLIVKILLGSVTLR